MSVCQITHHSPTWIQTNKTLLLKCQNQICAYFTSELIGVSFWIAIVFSIDFSVLCRRLAPTQNLMASHVFQEISIKIKAHSILHGKIDSIFDDFPSHFHSFRAVLYPSEMGNLDVSNFETFLFRHRLEKPKIQCVVLQQKNLFSSEVKYSHFSSVLLANRLPLCGTSNFMASFFMITHILCAPKSQAL